MANFILVVPLEMNKSNEVCKNQMQSLVSHWYLISHLLELYGANKEEIENVWEYKVRINVNIVYLRKTRIVKPRSHSATAFFNQIAVLQCEQ